jgi:hypothetical protein
LPLCAQVLDPVSQVGGVVLDRVADHAAVAVEIGELVQDRGL